VPVTFGQGQDSAPASVPSRRRRCLLQCRRQVPRRFWPGSPHPLFRVACLCLCLGESLAAARASRSCLEVWPAANPRRSEPELPAGTAQRERPRAVRQGTLPRRDCRRTMRELPAEKRGEPCGSSEQQRRSPRRGLPLRER